MNNGIECLYQVYKDCIQGLPIDLILIDENMPFMIGSECIKNLKRLMSDKNINKFKIFSISGYMDPEHVNYIIGCGADGFYSKPISMTMMKDLLIKSEIITKK